MGGVAMDEQTIITVINEKGQEIECTLLFVYDSDQFDKNYIVYTDNTVDEDGCTQVYASIYDPTGESNDLGNIDSQDEWDTIQWILTSLQETIKSLE